MLGAGSVVVVAAVVVVADLGTVDDDGALRTPELLANARPPLLLASFSAKYSRRRRSKSGSFKSSSRRRARSVEACFSFGISSRVAASKCRATPRNFTTASVCAANVLYIRRARSLSGRDISK